jgi:hypothetical protein
MFRLFFPSEQPAAKRRRLALEPLESRDCPSTFTPTQVLPADPSAATPGSTFTPTHVLPADLSAATPGNTLNVTVSHTYLAGHDVHVTGAVSGPGAANATVEFQGQVSGLATANPDGTFDFVATADNLGNVLVGAVTGTTVTSNITSDPITNTAPVIVNFAVKHFDSTTCQFTGQVLGNYPPGLVVYFGGAPASLQTQQATVQSDGTFSLTLTMAQGDADTGNANAQVQADWWGAASNVAYVLVQ